MSREARIDALRWVKTMALDVAACADKCVADDSNDRQVDLWRSIGALARVVRGITAKQQQSTGVQ